MNFCKFLNKIFNIDVLIKLVISKETYILEENVIILNHEYHISWYNLWFVRYGGM